MIVNGSHLIGYLSQRFCVSDFYGYDLEIFDFNSIEPNSVVYVDDEIFCISALLDKFLSLITNRRDIVWIVKIQYVYDKLIENGNKAVLEPYFHIMDDLLCMKVQGAPEIVPKYGDKNYFCLNRNYNVNRQRVLNQLRKNNLLNFGYVTANATQFEHNHLFKHDPMTDYVAVTTGYERCNENNLLSTNVKNFYNIAEKPGYTAIVVESGYHLPDYKSFFPTEKTIIPFLTHRLPLIYGDANVLHKLEKDGLDIFKDILDQSYDLMDYHDPKKSKKMIKTNIDVLKNGVNIKKLKKRLKRNYNFLRNEWLDAKLQNFLSNILTNIN